MSFFSSHSGYYLGVDFGTQSIKAIELQYVKGKARLSNYGIVNVTNVKEVPDAYDGDYAKKLSDALKALFTQMKPRTRKAVVAIPSFNGLVMIVDFPRMGEKDIASAIKFESRKYIPASLDEVNVSWEILEEDENDRAKPTMKVLLVAAPKSEVQYYDSLFRETDVKIDSLELESFSLVRSVVGNTKGRFILVDIGAKTTNIVLINDGIVHVSRSVDIGGADMTNAIMQSLNISRERAVVLKEGGENFFTGATRVGFPSLNYVASEVKRVLDTQKSDAIESLILCGGGSLLTGLPEFLGQLTGLPVTIGNALSRVIYDEATSGKIKELSGAFAVAIGLALREIEEEKK
jgi:type IV pilus assembly protein PilM